MESILLIILIGLAGGVAVGIQLCQYDSLKRPYSRIHCKSSRTFCL